MTNYSHSSPNFSIESLLKKDKGCGAKNVPMNRTDDVRRQFCSTSPSTILHQTPSLFLPMGSTSMSVHQGQGKTTLKSTCYRDEATVKNKKTSSQKRTRTAFTNFQIKELESEFKSNRYLTISRRSELAKSLELRDNQIKIWFQNRRTKLKRQIAADIALSMARPGHLIPSHPTIPSYCIQCQPTLHTTLQGCWHHNTTHSPYMMDHPINNFQYESLGKIVH